MLAFIFRPPGTVVSERLYVLLLFLYYFFQHAKFGLISVDFKVRRRISPKRIKAFKIRLKILYRGSSGVG